MTQQASFRESATNGIRACSDAQAISVVTARLRCWYRHHRTRQQLRRLEDQRLSDIGLSDTERRREVRKWFWQK